MKHLVLGLAVLFAGCQEYSRIEYRPLIFSPKFRNGPLVLDSNAVVIISTFGGLVNTISDYRRLPLRNQISGKTEEIDLSCPLINLKGGYYFFTISRDSFYDAGTDRSECGGTFHNTSDTINANAQFPTRELVDQTKNFTQGSHNKNKFYSAEMRPLLLALRGRACEISDSDVFFKPNPIYPEAHSRDLSDWNDVKKILSVPDSCR